MAEEKEPLGQLQKEGRWRSCHEEWRNGTEGLCFRVGLTGALPCEPVGGSAGCMVSVVGPLLEGMLGSEPTVTHSADAVFLEIVL